MEKLEPKFDSVKTENTEIASKPAQKPNDRPSNKILRSKIDINKEPRNKIQREKINLSTPPRNKIDRLKIDINAPTRNKIQPRVIDPKNPSRHKIEPRKIDPNKEPKHKLTPRQKNLSAPSEQKIKNPNFIPKDPSYSTTNMKNLNLEEIKKEIKNVDWESISNDWSITTRPNQYTEYKKIPLDPTKEVSKENPLYRHKEWLNKIYNNKEWKLNDKYIAKLCGVDPTVIGKWRKNLQISTKLQGKGKWMDNRSGKVYVRVPRDKNNPRLTDNSRSKSMYKLEHIHNMEVHLSRHSELEISKKFLVDGKYLKPRLEVHHINQKGRDNRIKNLWIYENKKEHAKGELSLYEGLKTLVSTNYIKFKDERYFLNPDIDSLKPRTSELVLESKNQINYKDINIVKEEIKKIDWKLISNDWLVQVKKNQFVQKTVKLDPTRDPSKENPLYQHKEWLKHIINDDRFNLTDSRIAKLCGITRDTTRYWRDKKYGIKGKTEWGFERRIDDKDERIWIKVPKDYANPVVQKEDHHRRFMLEHRYIIEQHLAKHPELEISKTCLSEGKYLKTEAHVHHINLNYQDNRIENLWVFESDKNHKEATKSLYNLVEKLLQLGKIRFEEGKYLTVI
jgi:hypothetical protein